MKICPKCKKQLNDDAKFCAGCGSLVSEVSIPLENEKACPKCGKILNESAKFCPLCGSTVNDDKKDSGTDLEAGVTSKANSENNYYEAVHSESQDANETVLGNDDSKKFQDEGHITEDADEKEICDRAEEAEDIVSEKSETIVYNEKEENAAPGSDKKFCAGCGAQCKPDAVFCPSCGKSFKAVSEKTKTEKSRKNEKEKTPKKDRTRAKYAFGKFLKASVAVMTALIMILGLGYSLILGTSRFKPLSDGTELSTDITDDGTLGISLKYTPSLLTFKDNPTSEISIGIENKTSDIISDLSLNVALPSGISAGDASLVLSAEKIGPGATKTFKLPVTKQNPMDSYFVKIVIVMALTAVLTTVFIVFFALVCKKQSKLMLKMTSAVLTLSFLLPGIAVLASPCEKSVGEAALVYNEESGLAEQMSVSVTSNGNFEMGKGSSGKLSFTANYSLEQRLTVDTVLDKDSGTLTVSWNEIEGAEKYRVFISDDGENFRELGETDALSYEASAPSSSRIQYYRVAAETAKGEMYSSDARVMTLAGGKFFADSDCDLLSNELEDAFGTSKALEDTDGDGLSDFYEIAVSMTDPLVYDSDGSGIGDGEKDPDGDGLTNAEEAKYNTNPLEADSDGDGLSDYIEIKEFMSNPANKDSDGDGLSDGTEYILSTDPNSSDSDGDGVPDKDSEYTAKIEDEEKSGASAELSDSGNGFSVAEITDITDTTTIKDLEYVISPVISLVISDGGSGRITVPVTNSGENGEIVLGVYSEENGDFSILEDSKVSEDGKSVSASLSDEHYTEVSRISDSGEELSAKRMIYCAFYVANWHAQFEAPLSPERGEDAFFDVEFVIDESGSMEDASKSNPNDPNRYRVTAAKSFASSLIQGDRAAVVGFNEEARRKNNLTEDMNAVSASIDSIVGDAGGTALYAGINEALTELIAAEDASRGRFIIALTDGEDSGDAGDAYEKIIESCTEHGIPIYTIALGSSVNTSLLSKLATYTGGSFFHIQNADDLPQAFNRIQNNAFYGDDTDGDGLADEIEKFGLRDGKGKIYYTDPAKRFTDDDDMSDGEEAGNVMYCQTDSEGNSVKYYIMLSDPTKGDTDGDGIDDLDEKLMGTLPWCSDTDGDGLSDGLELSMGYDPLNKNIDGDSFTDADEYYKSQSSELICDVIKSATESYTATGLLLTTLVSSIGYMDPYSYDLNIYEKGAALLEGALLGDFGDMLANAQFIRHELTDSVYYMLGQTILDFIPAANVVVSIRDAVASLIDGDFAGVVFSLCGLIPEGGSALKAVSDVCGFLEKIYNIREICSDYTGKFELRNVTTAPAFTFLILRAIRMIEEKFKTDLSISSVDTLVKAQLEKGTLGMTKESARNFEIFTGYGKIYSPVKTSDIVTVSEEIKISVSNTSLPTELSSAVRGALNTVPGGSVSTQDGKSVYTLVRTFDLETSELARGATLEIALHDAIDRTANYNDINISNLEKHLCIVLTDCIVSKSSADALKKAVSYASEKDVSLEFKIYLTSDDTSNNTSISEVNPSEKSKAVMIVPGITGSELVAAEDFTGFGSVEAIREGDLVWIPAGLDAIKQELAEECDDMDILQISNELLGRITAAVAALNMIQMDERGKALYKLEGKQVAKDDGHVGALNTGIAMYKALLEEYGDTHDVIFYNYDWRFSVDEAARDMESFINAKGYDEVTFVCHSMGGIVTSYYLSQSEENVKKAGKVITVGTPYGGAPKALLALQTGKFIDFSGADGIMKGLAYNIPAVYDLLPYNNIIDNFGGYITESGTVLDSQETRRFLLDSAAAGAAESPSVGINNYLYSKAMKVQDDLYSSGSHIMNRSDIDAYIIAGYNVPTVMYMNEKDGTPFEFGKAAAGDGTVPLMSAVTTDGKLFDHPVYFVKNVDHTGLFSDNDVIELIKNIINSEDGSTAAFNTDKICSKDSVDIDSALTGDALYEKIEESLLSDILRGIYNTVVAHCPVSLSLWKGDEKLGTVGSAGIRAKEGYEEYFDLMDEGETKQVIVPEGCTVKIEGTGKGEMDVDIFSSNARGELLKSVSLADIPVSDDKSFETVIKNTEKLEEVILNVSSGESISSAGSETVTYSAGAYLDRGSDARGWILLGAGVFMVIAAVLSMCIIAKVNSPSKKESSKPEKAKTEKEKAAV